MKLEEAKGDWALVTGASAGIGREFAVQLASAGINVILIARRGDLLNTLGDELSQRYKIRTLSLPADLTQPNAITDIKSRLENEGIKVRLMVNNAASGYWGQFEETQPDAYVEMVRLNIIAMVSLCRLFFADLSSFPTSAIINISSQAALNPIPFMAVYAATKAFVSSFSQALYGEWKDRGILVQTVIPGPTETEFDTIAGAPANLIKRRGSTESVVKASFDHLAGAKPLVTNAKGIHKQRLFASLFPAKIVIKTVARMFRPPE